MSKIVYQVQIALRDYRPKIWRRLLIPSDLLLSDFHKVIQSSMGWTNSHLHQFIKNRVYFTMRMKDDDMWDDMNSVDYKKMKVSDLLKAVKEKIIYEYDFGDGWQHDIILEKILAYDDKLKHPICLAGKMNCPPEDCGGIWGYSNMLEILKQPKHEEYESFVEWLGGDFDPEEFDIDYVNELLSEKDFGCMSLF
ncbi:MAG: plasmid pRiA4b ORF-3 family protein [Ignavibacteria bacterium]|nr:plasmid pRiA4b ORF-3 family protein [Ignavibacteria bacterium]